MDPEDRIADILAELRERCDRGEDPSLEEIVEANPELADELRSHFDVLGLVETEFRGAEGPPLRVPEEIGEYRILREVGRGGMGTVYEALQTSMGRRVALKVLSPAVTSARQAVRRFRREARASGLLHHTNIVPVYGMGEAEGFHYFAMELVDGPPLGDALAGSGDFCRIAGMTAGVADALHAAHEAGIIHRDVKPANLLLSADGTLKLVDFGLAQLRGEGLSMTMTGQLLGTPSYMSPEQAMAKRVPVDHRTDIFSLGATLYELLTHRLPFQGDSLQEVCSQIISTEPVPPRKLDPRIPRDLETIVCKAMEKDRDRRYQTAEEMGRDLRRFAEGAPIRARRIGLVGRCWRKIERNRIRSALVTAVLLLVAIAAGLGLRTCEQAERIEVYGYEEHLADAENEIVVLLKAVQQHDHARPPPIPSYAAVRKHYASAVARDGGRWEARFGLAVVPGAGFEEQEENLEQARRLGLPAKCYHLARSHILEAAGRPEDAAKELERGERISARATPALYFVARLVGLLTALRECEMETQVIELHLTGAFEEALALADSLCALDRGTHTHWRVDCLRALGRIEEAREIARPFTAGAERGCCAFCFAYLCAAARRNDKARTVLEGTKPSDDWERYHTARAYAMLGDEAKALEWLEAAVRSGHRRPRRAAPDHEFGWLVGNEAYRRLLERLVDPD